TAPRRRLTRPPAKLFPRRPAWHDAGIINPSRGLTGDCRVHSAVEEGPMKKTTNILAGTLCALATMAPGGVPASAVAVDAHVAFKAYRDRGALVVKDGGGRGTSVADDGTVEVHHEHGAIRFTFKPASAAALHTDPFERIDGRQAAPVL